MKNKNALKIVVTGGAGYIGSFIVKSAAEKGHEVIVVDYLNGEENGQVAGPNIKFINADLKDKKLVDQIFGEHKPDIVIHLAAHIGMAESMSKPHAYFENNVNGSLNVLEAMVKHNVGNIIFSSSAGVYGDPVEIPIKEGHPKNPNNPYGEINW